MLSKVWLMILGIFFFVFVSLGTLSWVALDWSKLPDEEAEVEIDLPVIDWNRYLNLSKQAQ